MNETFFGGLAENINKSQLCRVAVPLAQDEAVAYAVCEAVRRNIAGALLVGDSAAIKAMYKETAEHPAVKIVHETDAAKACYVAIDAIRSDGAADILMKGLVPTAVILKAALDSNRGLKKNPLLSHLTFFELPNQAGLKILTDAALNIAPDVEMLVKEVENAIEAFKMFVTDRPPRVALLAANEKVSEKMPSTVLAKGTSEAFADRSDVIVEGPLSLDLACSRHSCEIKGYEGRIQGDADIFVVPRIESGNVLYKSLQYFVHAQMGGMIYGAKCPIVLTSRADDNATKLNSLLLGIKLWQANSSN